MKTVSKGIEGTTTKKNVFSSRDRISKNFSSSFYNIIYKNEDCNLRSALDHHYSKFADSKLLLCVLLNNSGIFT